MKFEPTVDYDVFSKSLALKNEPVSDSEERNAEKVHKPLTWRRNRGPCKSVIK